MLLAASERRAANSKKILARVHLAVTLACLPKFQRWKSEPHEAPVSSVPQAIGSAAEKLLPELNIKRAKDKKPPLEWQKTFGLKGELDKGPKEPGVKVPDLSEKGKTTCFYQVTSGDPTGVGQDMRLLVENFSRSDYSEGTDLVVVTQVKPSPLKLPQLKPGPLPLPPLVPKRER